MQTRHLEEEISRLKGKVQSSIGKGTHIEAGVGVDLKMLLSCLHTMDEYLDSIQLQGHRPRNAYDKDKRDGNDNGKIDHGDDDDVREEGGKEGEGGREGGREGGQYHIRAGILKSLSGMKVRIGKYLGLSDDGCVIIPWDVRL